MKGGVNMFMGHNLAPEAPSALLRSRDHPFQAQGNGVKHGAPGVAIAEGCNSFHANFGCKVRRAGSGARALA